MRRRESNNLGGYLKKGKTEKQPEIQFFQPNPTQKESNPTQLLRFGLGNPNGSELSDFLFFNTQVKIIISESRLISLQFQVM